MGLHFANLSLVFDDVLDAAHPEIVIYEPLPNGRLRLIGADYLVLADAWNATHDPGPTTRLLLSDGAWTMRSSPIRKVYRKRVTMLKHLGETKFRPARRRNGIC